MSKYVEKEGNIARGKELEINRAKLTELLCKNCPLLHVEIGTSLIPLNIRIECSENCRALDVLAELLSKGKLAWKYVEEVRVSKQKPTVRY